MADELSPLARLTAGTLLSPGQVNVLARLAARGDRVAHAQLVAGNTRLVLHIAARYRSQLESAQGFDFEDVVQEGMIGLNRAARDFDPSRGLRFSTYATFAIKQRIGYALQMQSRTIHQPDNFARLKQRVASELTQTPDAADEELAERLSTSIEQIRLARDTPHVADSLDRPLSDNEARTLESVLRVDSSYTGEGERRSAATEADLSLLEARYLDRRSSSELRQATGLTTRQLRSRERDAITRLGNSAPSPSLHQSGSSRAAVAAAPALTDFELVTAYRRLSPRLAATLGIYFESGRSQAAVADAFATKSSAVVARIYRATDAVSKRLSRDQEVSIDQLERVVLAERVRLSGAVARLNPTLREVARLRLLAGMTQAQIAAATGMSYGAVVRVEPVAVAATKSLLREGRTRAHSKAFARSLSH